MTGVGERTSAFWPRSTPAPPRFLPEYDTVLLGHARPGRDGWVHPDSAWADPQGGHVFDPAKANADLDAAGIRRGEDGIRRTADGAKIEFAIAVAAAMAISVSRKTPLAATAVNGLPRKIQPAWRSVAGR